MARDRNKEAQELYEDLRKPDEPEDKGPPDLLVLDSHTGFMLNGTLRNWEGGVAITNPADIADLKDMPGKRYRLIKD
jgi:hypothetical protein